MSCQDTGIRLWLADESKENRESVLQALKSVSGVTQIFELQKTGAEPSYKVVHSNFDGQPKRFREWAETHNLNLVNSTANALAPDYVVALADNVGLGDNIGDHGGLQEIVQRIPMIIYTPGAKGGTDSKELRLVDLKNLVLQSMF